MSPTSPIPPAIAIDGELTISTVASWRDALVGTLGGLPARIDLSAVTALDAAGLQLLMLIAREARRAGAGFELHDPSRAVRASLAMARLGQDLTPEAAA